MNNLATTDEHATNKAYRLVADEHAIVTMTDPAGYITYVNDNFCKINGYSRHEALGRSHKFLSSGHHPQEFFTDMWQTISKGQTWQGEICNRAKNGSFFWVDTTISPIMDGDGHILQYIAIRRDITKRKALESNLKVMLVKANAADKTKSEFLSNMSHEIRTPMTAIIGFAESLSDPTLPEADKIHAIEVIRRNGDSLLELINSILDLSKLDAEMMTIESLPCQLRDIIADTEILLQGRADAKGLRLDVEYAGPMPETIHTDPARLRQILVNLVGNSIKFTESGSIRIIARLANGKVQLDVVDAGCGMTDEQATKLFKPFAQADNSVSRKFGGTGLGLIISKRFAEMLGGDIVIVKTGTGGSTFRVTLDPGLLDGVKMLEDAGAARVLVPKPVQADIDITGLNILLAEDGPDNQRLISFVLERAGADVTVVENGELALAKIAAVGGKRADDPTHPFDCILMDMQMPIMDGYQATSNLRARGYTSAIVALTAHAMAGDREKCIDAGCDDYATKPINRKKLIATIVALTAAKKETIC